MGIIIAPMDDVSATDEPEIPPKNIEARMFTAESPPRIHPTRIPAKSTIRRAMPPRAMIVPASTKNGMARSAKTSIPSEILRNTVTSGIPR